MVTEVEIMKQDKQKSAPSENSKTNEKQDNDKAKFTDAEYDVLKECGNVGIGNAATALSTMLNKKVEINIPETKFVPIERFADELGGPEAIVEAIYLEVLGDLTGESLFVFPESGARELVDLMMGQEIGTTKSIGENENSAIKEMANIVMGAYLSSLATMMDMKILPNIPHTASDMVQALMDFMLAKFSTHSNEILIVKEKIGVDGNNINGTFIIILDDKSLKKMIDKIHSKYEV